MTNYLGRLKICSDHLREAGAEMQDQDLAYSMLAGLPESYDGIIMTFSNVEDKEFTSSKVKHVLLVEYERWMARLVNNTNEALQFGTTTRKEDKKKKNFTCYKCGKEGHIARSCRGKAKTPAPNLQPPRCSTHEIAGSEMLTALSCAIPDNSWVIDSGAIHHVCNKREWFTNFQGITSDPILRASGTTRAEGCGDIKFKAYVGKHHVDLKLCNVLYVPDVRQNLLSVSRMKNKGKIVNFANRRAQVFDSENRIVAIAHDENGLYVMKGRVILPNAELFNSQKSSQKQTLELWHQRFCHVNNDAIERMAKGELVKGPSSSEFASPCTVIPKKNDFRLCIDYCKLNDETTADPFPFPRIDNIINLFGGCHYFTKIDLRDGFWQLVIMERTLRFAAFVNYRMWNPIARKIIISRDVIFTEANTSENIQDNQQEQVTIYSEESVDSTNTSSKPEESCRYPLRNRIREKEQSSTNCTRAISYACYVHDQEPLNYEDAIVGQNSKKWKLTMDDEFNSLMKNQTWTYVTLPSDRKAIACKWVYKLKQNADGSNKMFKARLVAKGYSQKSGLDYGETFSPVVKFDSIRTILSLCASLDMEMIQLDVKSAFLNGDLEEELYMEQPQGYENPDFPNHVCSLQKSIYGLKQSPRMWNKKFHEFLIKFDLKPSISDSCVYTSVGQPMERFLIREGASDKQNQNENKEDKKIVKSTGNKRKYIEDYLKYGFIPSVNDPSLPFCLICQKTLSNETMVPSKLLRHIETNHQEQMNNPISYFENIRSSFQKQSKKFKKFMTTSDEAQTASYMIAQLIARKKKAHAEAEEIILPALKIVAGCMLTNDAMEKVTKIPLSSKTIARRIEDMSEDIELQIKQSFNDSSTKWAIQLDETTDISNKAQLLAFFRDQFQKHAIDLLYVCSNDQAADIFTKALPPERYRRLRSQLGLFETTKCLLASDSLTSMLSGLPDSFDTLVMSFGNVEDSDFTSNKVRNTLLTEYERRSAREGASSGLGEALNFSKDNTRKTSRKQGVKCYRCSKIGHIAKGCRSSINRDYKADKRYSRKKDSFKSQSENMLMAFNAVSSEDEFILDSGATHHVYTLNKLAKNSVVNGLEISKGEMSICDDCCMTKSTMSPYKIKTKNLLELVHSDLCGPFPVDSFAGPRYFLTFTDDFSRRVIVYFLKHKDQVIEYFDIFRARAERETGHKIKRLRTDNSTLDNKVPEVIWLSRKVSLRHFNYADYGSDTNDRRSYSGMVAVIDGNVINWRSKKQQCVSLSTMESEYIALCHSAKEAIWLGQTLSDLGFILHFAKPLTIYCDNRSAIDFSKNNIENNRSKHISVQFHYKRDKINSGDIVVQFVNTKENMADIQTKTLKKLMHRDASRKGVGYDSTDDLTEPTDSYNGLYHCTRSMGYLGTSIQTQVKVKNPPTEEAVHLHKIRRTRDDYELFGETEDLFGSLKRGRRRNQDLAYSMFAGLPESYDGIIMTFSNVEDKEFTSSKVKHVLLAEYERRMARRVNNTNEALQFGTTTRKEDKKKKNFTCYKCGKEGHIARSCRGTAKTPAPNFQPPRCSTHEIAGSEMLTALSCAIPDNSWVIDSSATHHVCNKRERFTNFQGITSDPILTASGTTRAEGCGDIKFKAYV
ncbi:hypothetical protein LAZ67_19000134, partial [Cordylochernes scorpioides]